MAMPPPPPLASGFRVPAARRPVTDSGVQVTNDDAQLCKLSCVSRGYFSDDFVHLFVKRPQRKAPLINRGYWARYAVMRQLLQQFLAAATAAAAVALDGGRAAADDDDLDGGELHLGSTQAQQQQQQQGVHGSSICCQVVVLGSGFDTTWFHLVKQGLAKTSSSSSSNGPPLGPLSQAPPPTSGPPNSSSSSHGQGLPALRPPGSSQNPPACGAPGFRGLSGGTGFRNEALESSLAAAGVQLWEHARFIEVDFPEVAAKKARVILGQPPLVELLPSETTAAAATATAAATAAPAAPSAAAVAPGTQATAAAPPGFPHHPPATAHHQQAWVKPPSSSSSSSSGCSNACAVPEDVAGHARELLGSSYSLVGADLRRLTELDQALTRGGLDRSLPTLWVSECCFIYLESQEVEALLSWAATATSAPAAVAIYEQTRPDDAFGQMMIQNLEERGCPLRSLAAVPRPADQVTRLTSSGWDTAAAADVASLYYSSSSGPGLGSRAQGGWFSEPWEAERQRVERLEPLDELEEWQLMQAHYCLAIGVKVHAVDAREDLSGAGPHSDGSGALAGQGHGRGAAGGGWLADALGVPCLRALPGAAATD